MKTLLIIATIVALSAAATRNRRQANGCFWWEPDNNCDENAVESATVTNPTPVEETRAVNEERIANTDTNNLGPRTPTPEEVSNWSYCNNGLGRCVPYYLCREGNIVTDGAGLIDIRIGPNRNSTETRTTSSSECEQFLDVCCNDPEAKPLPIPDPIPPENKLQCGVRYEEGVHTRILGFADNQAQFGEFPWMAAVLRKEYIESKELNLYVCGGSLIHPNIVLTAAHCVHTKDAASLKVRLGEWDTQRTYELYPHIDRNVIKVTVHEGYNPGALWNDFALLFLDAPADIAPNVNTVCLPQQGQSFDYATCWATGWGRDEFGKEGNYQNVLKEVALPVVPKAECEQALRTTRLGQFFRLDNSFLCAGGQPGLDTCKGDGGSPLVCEVAPNTNIYVQAGIVAWGIGCGENGIPGVYADVSGASDWIITKADEGLFSLYNLQGEGYWRNY
ncbi:hypothetical protein SK128_015686 [Halocaridina rubra]|uniref:Peptidase S1 domain-containing protein n=1 Tax=Halocaridina rubra TaxID=373956 RepID=A0AAN8ZZ41_HALRR